MGAKKPGYRSSRAVAFGADNGARTRDPNLGKVVLYQLSHVRICKNKTGAGAPGCCLEAKPGFEPGVKALQASALPLGHFAEKGPLETVRKCNGADNGARTRDPNLGKVVLYQLSHVRLRVINLRELSKRRKYFFQKTCLPHVLSS